MRIDLNIAGVNHDVTPFVSKDLARLSQEREYDTFLRSVDDVRLRLSNIGGTVGGILSGLSSTAIYDLRVKEDRLLFRGRVSPSLVEYRPEEKWYDLTAFSIMKAFWDKAAVTRARPSAAPALGLPRGEVISLQQLLERELIYLHWFRHEGLFESIDLGEYADYQIRDWSDSTQYGNIGRFRDLDPAIMWDDLLKQIALYHNAEWWIDLDSGALKLTRRYEPAGSLVHDLRQILLKDPELQPVSESVADYVQIWLPQTATAPSIQTKTLSEFLDFNQARWFSLEGGLYSYIMICYLNSVARWRSPSVDVLCDKTDPQKAEGWQITLDVPPGPEGTTRREIYRFSSETPGYLWNGPFFLTELEGNNAAVVVDAYGPRRVLANLSVYGNPPPHTIDIGTGFLRYDESAGTWLSPIYEGDEENKPTGKVFDVRPHLRFTAPESQEVLDEDPESVSAFFVDARPITKLHETYENLMTTRPRIRVGVIGLDYRIGDRALLDLEGLAARTYVIVKVESDLQRNESTIEAIAL